MFKRRVCGPTGNDGLRSSHPWSAPLQPAILCIALLMSSCSKEKVIGINERIHHDDFEYKVIQLTVTDSIGSGEKQRRATGLYYLVTFEVENRAKRVNHEWDNSIAYVIDDLGRKYENLPELQEFLNTLQPFSYSPQHVTPAGASETTRLVFDLPRNVARPYLMVRGELLMGDLFDGKAFTRTKVRLF